MNFSKIKEDTKIYIACLKKIIACVDKYDLIEIINYSFFNEFNVYLLVLFRFLRPWFYC